MWYSTFLRSLVAFIACYAAIVRVAVADPVTIIPNGNGVRVTLDLDEQLDHAQLTSTDLALMFMFDSTPMGVTAAFVDNVVLRTRDGDAIPWPGVLDFEDFSREGFAGVSLDGSGGSSPRDPCCDGITPLGGSFPGDAGNSYSLDEQHLRLRFERSGAVRILPLIQLGQPPASTLQFDLGFAVVGLGAELTFFAVSLINGFSPSVDGTLPPEQILRNPLTPAANGISTFFGPGVFLHATVITEEDDTGPEPCPGCGEGRLHAESVLTAPGVTVQACWQAPNCPAPAVPEPPAVSLLCVACAALGTRWWRRR